MAQNDKKRAKPDTADRVLEEGQDLLKEVVGVNDWQRSRFGAVLGLGAFGTSLRNAFGGVGQFGKSTFRLARHAFSREAVPQLPTDSDDPAERFEVAQNLYQRSDQEIDELTAMSGRQAMVYFILTVIAICWGILVYPAVSTSLFFPIGYVFPFFPVFPLVALFLRASFYNWQLRHRRLGSFRDFWDSGELFSFSGAKKSRGKVLGAFIAALSFSLLVPLGVAWAQVPGDAAGGFSWTATLGENDLFRQLLSFVLPNVGPVGAPPEGGTIYQQPLANAFAAFNATLLVVGGGMLTWFTIAGTVASAHEGKVLGSRWHYIWAPMRVTAGIGFLAPVSGGFCAAQLLVLQLIVWGGGIANTVWVAYVDSFAVSQEGPSDTIVNMIRSGMSEDNAPFTVAFQQSAPTVRDLAAKSICFWTVANYNAAHGTATVDNAPWYHFGWITGGEAVIPATWPAAQQKGLSGYEWDFGPLCGEVSLDARNHDALNDLLSQSGLNAVEIEQELQEISTVVADGLEENVFSHLDSFGKTFVQNVYSEDEEERQQALAELTASGLHEDLLAAKAGYEQVITNVAAALQSKFHDAVTDGSVNALISDSKKFGWASSGVFYITLSRLQGTLHELSQINISVGGMNAHVIDEGGDLARMLFGSTEEASSRPQHGIMPIYALYWEHAIGRTATSDGFSEEAIRAGQLDSGNEVWELLSSLFNWGMMERMLGMMTVSPQNPLINMIDFGHRLLWIFTGALIAYVAASSVTAGAILGGVTGGAAAGAASGGALTIPGKIIGFLTGGVVSGITKTLIAPLGFMIKLLLMIMFVVGILHAYILPMIPYIMMFFFIVGMLILTVEAMVAAPIWAFFHIRMDGQEFIDQVQRPGYMIAFNLLLRPSLAVLGLVLSYSVFGAAAWFLSKTFYPAVVAATTGSSYSWVAIITMMVILSYLHWQLALRSFSLITTVPDRVTRWFGQGGENLGEENETQKSTNFMVGHMTNRMDGAARGLAWGSAFGKGQQQSSTQSGGDENSPETQAVPSGKGR